MIDVKIEGGQLVVTDEDGAVYSFDAHDEAPRPSLLGWGLSAGGRHWSNRDPSVPLERHTSVQGTVVGDGVVAWYTQEYLPRGLDYQVTDKGHVYIGRFPEGTQTCVYKGSCYGDLCFDGHDLYVNTGTRIGVIDIDTGVFTDLFKHSGMKKNGTDLRVTPSRIFFTHWTHNNFYVMWYDRTTGEVVHPHVDAAFYVLLDDTHILFTGHPTPWVLDVVTLKRRHFLSTRESKALLEMLCAHAGVPSARYAEHFYIFLTGMDADRPQLHCRCFSDEWGSRVENDKVVRYVGTSGLPYGFSIDVTCDSQGQDMQLVSNDVEIASQDPRDFNAPLQWHTVTGPIQSWPSPLPPPPEKPASKKWLPWVR